MIAQHVRQHIGIERVDVEALPLVFDNGQQVMAVKAQADLDLLRRAAVTDGVRAGLLDGQHHIVDDLLVRAVEGQIVANAVACTE